MIFFCPDCNDYMNAREEDNTFDHEFGREYIYDYICPKCDRHLHASRERPRKEVEKP